MKRRTRWRIAGLLVLFIVAAFALLVSLPFAKEGTSWTDLPIVAGAAGVCLALALVWWIICGFSPGRAALGWVVLSIPLLAHGSLTAGLILERFDAERLGRQAKITQYTEDWLELPGFDGPVGVEMTLRLEHPAGASSLIHPPEIRMGPPATIPYGEHYARQTLASGFVRPALGGSRDKPLAILKTVLFQRRFANPASAAQWSKFNAETRFAQAGTTELHYVVMPGIVDFIGDDDRICLNSRVGGLPACGSGVDPSAGCASQNMATFPTPAYSHGQSLSSLWVAGGTADLSTALDEALHKGSKLQGDPETWADLHRRLEPGGLIRAGYSLCPAGDDSHTAQRVCFCRSIAVE